MINKNLQVGSALIYRIFSELKVFVNPLGVESPNQQQDLSIQAQAKYRLHLTVLFHRPNEGTWFHVRWSDWQLVSIPELPDWKKQTQQVGDWYLQVAPNGVLYLPLGKPDDEKFHAPRANAVWMLQFVLPESDPIPKHWQIREPYLSCEALCTYQQKGQKGKRSLFQKRYERALLTEEERSFGKAILLEGTLTYEQIVPMIWERIEGKVRENSFFQGKQVGSNEITLTVRLEKVVPPSAKTLRMAHAFRPPQGNKAPLYIRFAINANQEKARAKALLGDRSLHQLWKELEALETSPEGNTETEVQKRTELALALEGAAVLYPDQVIPKLKKILADAEVDSPRFWVVLGALGKECVPVLMEVYQESSSVEKRIILLRQMSFCTPHSKRAFEILHLRLRSITDTDEHRQAILTLAAWVPYLKEPTPAAVRQFIRWTREEAGLALSRTDVDEQMFWLGVFRNLKDDQQIDLVDRFAQRGEETVRQEAVSLLIDLLPKDNIGFSEKLYLREPSPKVRLAVVQKVVQWLPCPEAHQLVERALFNDPEQSVRLELLKSLGEKAIDDSTALQLLVRASKTNSMESVRRQSLVILAALHAQGIKIPEE